MRQAKLYRYQLPMDSGVILREQKLHTREGWIVQLEERGNVGLGEIAPLVGFSNETMEEAFVELREHLSAWINGTNFNFDDMLPSVAFGLSMAELECHNELPEQGFYEAAPLCVGDPDDLIPKLEALSGQKIAKIKVGIYEPIRDGMLVNLFLESIPELKLRLDANRAWTPEKAAKFAEYIKPSFRQRISFIEEPCKQPGQSLTFGIETGIAIGWDETLQQAAQQPDFKLEELTGAKAIVVKPTLIGSVDKCISLIKKADSLGWKAVISSSIESSIGLNQLARLAALLTPNEVPGLDTMQLFKQQLETPWPDCDLPISLLTDHDLVLNLSSAEELAS